MSFKFPRGQWVKLYARLKPVISCYGDVRLLLLNIESQDDNHATFLDIEVDLEDNQFKTKR